MKMRTNQCRLCGNRQARGEFKAARYDTWDYDCPKCGRFVVDVDFDEKEDTISSADYALMASNLALWRGTEGRGKKLVCIFWSLPNPNDCANDPDRKPLHKAVDHYWSKDELLQGHPGHSNST